MLKFLFAGAVGAAILLFAPSPAAAETCTEAYTACSRICSSGHFFGGRNPERCARHCTGQRAHCMRTGNFRHIGNQWSGLKRS
jgi:hypothetical protein